MCESGTTKFLNSVTLIFWDFDGVIKDSVDIKTAAYERLFLPFGREIAARVKLHHEHNGGVSRFEKIPLYLSWVDELVTPARVEKLLNRFSELVLQSVVDSPWVPGIREYLLQHFVEQYFVLVTATPKEEIDQILAALELTHCFREVHGAPTKKACAIKDVLSRLECPSGHALMIGDAKADLQAAKRNSVPFLLRRTHLNLPIQAAYGGPMFDDLNNE